MAAQVEDAEGEEGGDDAGELVGDPEEAEADGQFEACVEVAQVENVVGDETAFQQTQQCSTSEERGASAEEGLHACNDRPRDHLDRDPAVRTELFGNQLGWQFGAEKANVEDCLPRVVIVCIHLEIVEHVIGKGLGYIATIELKCKEHQANPGADAEIQLDRSALGDSVTDGVGVCTHLAHQLFLLLGLPFESWVVAMFPFIVLNRRVERFITECFKRCIMLRRVNAMACTRRMVECLVSLKCVLLQTATSRGVAARSG